MLLEKKDVRKEIRCRISALTPGERGARDRAILDRALALPQLQCPANALLYYPLPDEIDLRPLFRELAKRGTVLCFPRMDRASNTMSAHAIDAVESELNVHASSLGLSEPEASMPVVAPQELDLIIVPGRAFTRKGDRLGRGGGYYDRFLAESNAARVALAYDEQILDAIPTGDHDLPVEVIVTQTEVIHTQG